MKKREGEQHYAWFRGNRFYVIRDQWYFSTREGIDFGPYETQHEADQALKSYIQEMNQPIPQLS